MKAPLRVPTRTRTLLIPFSSPDLQNYHLTAVWKRSVLVRQPRDLHHRPDLDRAQARRGKPRGNANGFIEIRRFDEKVSSQLFAGFGERPVCHQRPAVPYTDAGGGGHRL